MPAMHTPEDFNARGAGHLPGHLGIVITAIGAGEVRALLPVRGELMAPNGYLHAGSVVTLADTCAGYGCIASLPEGATGFTTVELKSNHLGTARDGTVECHARAAHLGRTLADLPVRMMLASDELRTVLVSIHVSLRDAIEAVTHKQVLQTLQITHDSLSRVLGQIGRAHV